MVSPHRSFAHPSEPIRCRNVPRICPVIAVLAQQKAVFGSPLFMVVGEVLQSIRRQVPMLVPTLLLTWQMTPYPGSVPPVTVVPVIMLILL